MKKLHDTGGNVAIAEKAELTYRKSFRECIQKDGNELLIFATDNLSQFPKRGASVNSKCDRALAVAQKNDLVVLHGSLDHEYQDWLHSQGFGSDHVVEYGVQSSEMTLAELIVKNPEPIKKIINKTGRKSVYVPWFSGNTENEAAKILGADLFGAPEQETIKYNDKASFKAICQELEIPVINGSLFDISSDKNENQLRFEQIVNTHLLASKTVIIRGTLGESGMSLYKTSGSDITEIYKQMANSCERRFIIEPFLEVSSSPNDQWVIDRDGNISHIGIQHQICEQGMIYVGTLKGKKFSQSVLDTISKISSKFVTHMARSGYKGVVGIDYIVTDKGIFPIENNARFNGSSYIRMIVDNIEGKLKTSIPYWKYIKSRMSPCSFSELVKRVEPILYDGNRSNCIFPFNCDMLSVSGDFGVVLLGKDMDQINHIENAVKGMGIKR